MAPLPEITGFSRLEPGFCVRIVCAGFSDGQFMIPIYLKRVASIKGSVRVNEASAAFQAENAGSIPVARTTGPTTATNVALMVDAEVLQLLTTAS